MIKLTIELKDEKFHFDYVMGKSRSCGETEICPDTMHTFDLMVQLCHKVHCQRYQEWMDEGRAKVYIEKHPELLKESKDET